MHYKGAGRQTRELNQFSVGYLDLIFPFCLGETRAEVVGIRKLDSQVADRQRTCKHLRKQYCLSAIDIYLFSA